MEIKDTLIDKFYEFIGEENLRYFKHLKGLKGSYAPVLKLNVVKRGVPVHPVHLREGMQIRNWMRGQDECKGWGDNDFDDNYQHLIKLAIDKHLN